MAIGKVGKNGTLNENGTFYSVQDVNALLENVGGNNYDLCLELTYGDDVTEIELINGNFNDLLNLMITEQPINAYIFAIYYSGSYQSNRTIRNCVYEANLDNASFINIYFTLSNTEYMATIDPDNNVTLDIIN